MALKNGLIGGEHWIDEISILIMLGSLGLFLYTHLHPVVIMMVSGLLGILIYT